MKTIQNFLTLVAGVFLISTEGLQAATSNGTDLAIGKTASANLASVGAMLSFQLLVTNLGPQAATSAIVTDTLPAGFQYVSSSGSGTYDPTTGQWNFAPGNPGLVSSMTIFVQATNPGTWLNTASILVSIPADTNLLNNTASALVTVNSASNSVPPIVLNCPSNITVTATSSSGATVYYTVTASGGCSPPPFVSAYPPSGSTFPIGTTTVFTSASDSCGNSTNCSFTVTVIAPPINLNCPSNITVTATGPSGAVVFYTVTADGGCSPPPFVSAYPPSGSTFPIGTTTVFTSASDSCGNSTNCSFTVTVNPLVYPPIVLTCPSNITVTAIGSGGTTVFFTATATGGCNPPPLVSANPPSGSTFPVGTTTVYTYASDSCGDNTNCSFTVTVVQSNCVISIYCPSNIVVTSSVPTSVYYNVSANDSCGGLPNIVSTPPSGSTFPLGTTTVNSTASDTNGSNSCSFTVTVVPPVYPPIVLNCSSNLTVNATSASGASVFFTVTASGGCSPPPNMVANPPSGSTFPIGMTTVNVTASDTCGNSTNCSFQVTVTKPPISLNCSSNITVTATSSNSAVVSFTVSATGGCSPPPSIMATPPSGSAFPIGTTTVNVTASDTCGTFTNCSFTVTVVPPAYPPIVLNCSSNLTVNATSSSGATVFYTVTASGGCSPPPNIVANPPSGSTFPVGTTTVFVNASDTCGTTTNCSFTVMVNPSANPQSNLQITKTADTNTVSLGDAVAFSITITNVGSTTASNITISDVLPGGFKYLGGSTVCGSFYDPASGLVTNTTLAPESSCYLSIVATATNAGTWTNIATIISASPANTNVNNSASAIVTVTQPLANLQITKTASTNLIPVGGSVNFYVTLTNVGPTIVSNITVTDLLPTGFVYTGSGSSCGSYNPSTGVMTVFTLNPGVGCAISIGAMATNSGTFTNTATITSSTPPNTNVNNSASAVVTATFPLADLAVTKLVSTNAVGPFTNAVTAYIGQTIYFQLSIVNNGPTNANNIIINDPLPPGLAYVSSQQFPYNPATGVWTIGTLNTNNGIPYMYLTCTATNAGAFTNIATVPAPPGLSDPILSNNTAQASVQVYQVYSISGYVRGCQSNGPAIPHTTMILSGAASQSVLTDTNGFYVFPNVVAGGTYTITPTQPGNVFNPASATVTLNANTNLPAFIGSIGQIRGKLSYNTNGTGVAGALVKLSGAQTRTVMSDANGVYAFTNTPPGNYTVMPVATNGFTFTPTNAAVTVSATNCVGQANFTAAERKVLLVAIEVVQVIQDWSNSVPLIQAKRTFVRVHLQLPTNGPAVLIQGAKLYVYGFPGSPLTPYAPGRSPDFLVQTTNAAALRGTFNNSLNFELPANWTDGSYPLRFVATNNVTVVPTNTVSANSSVQATFVPTVVPPFKFVGFNWTNWNNTNFQTVNAGIYGTVPRRVTAVYPLPDVTAAQSMLVAPNTLNVPQVIPNNLKTNGNVNSVYDWALINANAELLQMQSLDWLLSAYYGYTNWIYVGVLAGPTLGTYGWAGAYVTSSNTLATRAQNVSASFLQTILYGNNSARQTIPHEIGHNLGMPHDFNYMIYGFYKKNGVTYTNVAAGTCNIGPLTAPQFPFFQPIPPPAGALQPTLGPMTNGAPNSVIYGLDTFTLLNFPAIEPVADPNNCFDIMSYCRGGSPLERWSSSYFYNAVRSAINTQFAPPPPRPGPGPIRNWRFIRGYVDPDNDVGGLEPSWSVSSTVSGPPPTPASGDYVAALLDGNGSVIEAIPFAPVPFIVEETEAEEDLFSIPLIDDPAIQQVEIIDMLNSNIVSTMVAPTNLPSVSSVMLTATNGGTFTGTGPLVINWSAYDADPNAQLTYLIQFSSDGGNSWDTLDVDWPNLSYTIDSLSLRATTQGMIRVLASDGWNTSLPATSSQFTIPNHPPVLSLNAPADGSIYIADGQVCFDVTAVDPQDGPLDGNSVQWSSSRDGVLGYGAVLDLEADTLSEGTHLITVTATDAEGLSTSAQVTIYVVRQSPPTLAIQQIGNQIQLSWPSSVTNYVLQSTTSLLPMNWTTVTNVPVAADISQTVNLNLSSTNRFFRLWMPGTP